MDTITIHPTTRAEANAVIKMLNDMKLKFVLGKKTKKFERDFRQSWREMELISEGKMDAKNIDDLINEL
jgi:hypothetical protein